MTVVVVVVEVVLIVWLLVIVVVIVGIRDLGKADTSVEVLTVNMRVDVLVTVSTAAVGLFIDVLTAMIQGGLTNIDVNVLVYVTVNVLATSGEFVIAGPSEGLRC